MSQQHKAQHFRVKDDVHLQIGQQPVDAKAAEESCRIDAADDRVWFAQNPRAMMRERLASSRELKAHGLLPGTLAVIFRGPCGTQIRMFMNPAETN